MDLRQLQYFLVSAQKGSLTRAAEELYTTQPHVSQVIQTLERELGKKLFVRTGSGIVLTPEGEQARMYAENALKNVSLMKEVFREENKTLSIAANPSSRLAWAAGEFYLGQQGDFRLKYTESPTERMPKLLQNRTVDLGFLFVPDSKLSAFRHMAESRGLVFTTLLTSDLVVYSGEKGPFYGRESIRPEELDGCACIQMEDDFFQVEDILMRNEHFRSGKCALRRVIRTNSDHLMLHMLDRTGLCNIGSYWQGSSGEEARFTCSVVEGFRDQIVFGYLTLQGRPMRQEEEEFLALLRQRTKKRG